MSCPLCDRLAHLDALPPDDVVWQFPHSVALLGPWQYYTGYCVLVARRHAAELFELPDAERAAYLAEMTLLARAIAVAFTPRKMNYEMLGNQVPHPHWHLLPRRADDPDARQAVWLALARAEDDPAERARLSAGRLPRDETTRRLRAALRHLLSEAP